MMDGRGPPHTSIIYLLQCCNSSRHAGVPSPQWHTVPYYTAVYCYITFIRLYILCWYCYTWYHLLRAVDASDLAPPA